MVCACRTTNIHGFSLVSLFLCYVSRSLARSCPVVLNMLILLALSVSAHVLSDMLLGISVIACHEAVILKVYREIGGSFSALLIRYSLFLEICTLTLTLTPHSAIHSLTHLPIYLLTYLLTHPLTHSPTHSHLPTHLHINLLLYSITYLLTYSLTYPLTHLLIHPPTHSLIRPHTLENTPSLDSIGTTSNQYLLIPLIKLGVLAATIYHFPLKLPHSDIFA